MMTHERPTRSERGGVLRRSRCALLFVAALSTTRAVSAEEGDPAPRLGLAPGEPQTRSAPPQVPLGIPPSASSSNVFDFHGFLLLPLNVGVLQRSNPGSGQGSTALHTPPQIPQYLRTFGWTGVVPEPWAQLNFSYGNSTISGTVILGTRTFSDAAGYFNPVGQLGVTDAFVTTNLSKVLGHPFELKLGALTGRYGPMGAYDAGRYGTPLIARTNSIGETLTAAFELGDFSFVVEQGIGGQLGAPPRGMIPAGWNDFADEGVGASFVSHLHGGLGYAKFVQAGLHYFTAWSADDRAAHGATIPDGRINVLGADVRLTAGRYGHLYAGVARTQLINAGSVSGVIEILNSRGGPELIREYLGPDSGGDGALNTFGAQYDLSVARLVYDELYQGKSPDLRLSLFGMGTSVQSADDAFDGALKLKAGAEATYSVTSWFGLSTRFDHVRPDHELNRQAYHVISPRLLFHTDWESRDELALQYSHFIYGNDVVVRTGFPPAEDPTAIPDRHVFVMSGTYWW